jgi:hypothetical protein
VRLHVAAVISLAVSLCVPAFAADPHPHILQQPSISRDLIAFSYAGGRAAKEARFEPYVDSVAYTDLNYSPREGEVRTYLTDWANYRFTINRDIP